KMSPQSLLRAVQPEEGQKAPSRRPGILLLRLSDSAMRFPSLNDVSVEWIFIVFLEIPLSTQKNKEEPVII
ncbi:hypothetical protein Lcin_1600, partial [Legionella cincinnatiensis]